MRHHLGDCDCLITLLLYRDIMDLVRNIGIVTIRIFGSFWKFDKLGLCRDVMEIAEISYNEITVERTMIDEQRNRKESAARV